MGCHYFSNKVWEWPVKHTLHMHTHHSYIIICTQAYVKFLPASVRSMPAGLMITL